MVIGGGLRFMIYDDCDRLDRLTGLPLALSFECHGYGCIDDAQGCLCARTCIWWPAIDLDLI